VIECSSQHQHATNYKQFSSSTYHRASTTANYWHKCQKNSKILKPMSQTAVDLTGGYLGSGQWGLLVWICYQVTIRTLPADDKLRETFCIVLVNTALMF